MRNSDFVPFYKAVRVESDTPEMENHSFIRPGFRVRERGLSPNPLTRSLIERVVQPVVSVLWLYTCLGGLNTTVEGDPIGLVSQGQREDIQRPSRWVTKALKGYLCSNRDPYLPTV